MKKVCLVATVLFVALSSVAVAQAKPRQATLTQQKMCADQAAKRFTEAYEDWTEYSSHYNSRLNVCYLWVNKMTLGDDGTFDDLIIDAFEYTVEAHSFGLTAGKKMKECFVLVPTGEMVKCRSRVEFGTLVGKYFGIKSR